MAMTAEPTSMYRGRRISVNKLLFSILGNACPYTLAKQYFEYNLLVMCNRTLVTVLARKTCEHLLEVGFDLPLAQRRRVIRKQQLFPTSLQQISLVVPQQCVCNPYCPLAAMSQSRRLKRT